MGNGNAAKYGNIGALKFGSTGSGGDVHVQNKAGQIVDTKTNTPDPAPKAATESVELSEHDAHIQYLKDILAWKFDE
jgi:hypothetical protein